MVPEVTNNASSILNNLATLSWSAVKKNYHLTFVFNVNIQWSI